MRRLRTEPAVLDFSLAAGPRRLPASRAASVEVLPCCVLCSAHALGVKVCSIQERMPRP